MRYEKKKVGDNLDLRLGVVLLKKDTSCPAAALSEDMDVEAKRKKVRDLEARDWLEKDASNGKAKVYYVKLYIRLSGPFF